MAVKADERSQAASSHMEMRDSKGLNVPSAIGRLR
jgi:hypothetical protein